MLRELRIGVQSAALSDVLMNRIRGSCKLVSLVGPDASRKPPDEYGCSIRQLTAELPHFEFMVIAHSSRSCMSVEWLFTDSPSPSPEFCRPCQFISEVSR